MAKPGELPLLYKTPDNWIETALSDVLELLNEISVFFRELTATLGHRAHHGLQMLGVCGRFVEESVHLLPGRKPLIRP